MASETGRAQTRSSNTSGVRIINKVKNNVSRITREGKPKKVKVLYTKTEWRRDKSRVVRDTRNLVWKSGDHSVRLNTTLVTDREQVPWGNGEKDPGRGVKENLKPYVYKQIERFKARYRTFCRTVQRVIVYGEVKFWIRNGAEEKSSLNRAI